MPLTIDWAHGFRYGDGSLYEYNSLVDFGDGFGRPNGVDSYGANFYSGGSGLGKNVPPAAEKVAGFDFLLPAFGGVTTPFLFMGAGATHVSITHNPDFTLTVKHGDGTLLGTTPPIDTSSGAFHFIEARVLIDDVNGEVEIRDFGTPIISLTGIDTRNGASATIDHVRIGSIISKIDNFFIGSDFIATTSFRPSFFDLPPIGAGSSTDFAVTGAASNWQAVANNNGDTDYVSSSTLGQKDLYDFGSLPAGVTNIIGLFQWMVARKDDATMREIAATIRSGGVNSSAASVALINTFKVFGSGWTTDPATAAAFLKTAIDAIEAGFEVTL